jgi:ADP-heptose:LPS heptosyltransferase
MYLKKNGEKPIPLMDIKLTPSELAGGQKILRKLVKNDRGTICIFTYATGNKCYSKTWWATFYEKLQVKFVDHNILEILPVENISQIDFKATSFYSKEIREMASVMANTKIFIGADSGIMHLASASKLPTVGLFSVTNPEKYKPYNKGSMAINTEVTSQDEILEIVEDILYASSNQSNSLVR